MIKVDPELADTIQDYSLESMVFFPDFGANPFKIDWVLEGDDYVCEIGIPDNQECIYVKLRYNPFEYTFHLCNMHDHSSIAVMYSKGYLWEYLSVGESTPLQQWSYIKIGSKMYCVEINSYPRQLTLYPLYLQEE